MPGIRVEQKRVSTDIYGIYVRAYTSDENGNRISSYKTQSSVVNEWFVSFGNAGDMAASACAWDIGSSAYSWHIQGNGILVHIAHSYKAYTNSRDGRPCSVLSGYQRKNARPFTFIFSYA